MIVGVRPKHASLSTPAFPATTIRRCAGRSPLASRSRHSHSGSDSPFGWRAPRASSHPVPRRKASSELGSTGKASCESLTARNGWPRSRRTLVALAAVVLACGGGCDRRDTKAVAVVERELGLLKPPVGFAPTEQRVGLGEMNAEGGQTYCVSDERAGQAALDSMLRNAGWEPVSSSSTADATIWHYRKDQCLGSLVLENQQQPCGRRLRLGVVAPL
jgi:hypothetical protein